jgi:polar amino acid transport system substrate-binding protein
VEFPNPDETIAAVRGGEADLALADKDFLIPAVEAASDELFFVGEDIPLGGGIGMAFRQSDPELRDKFDAAIQSMKDDGTLNEMIKEHLGEDSPVH